MAHRCVHGKCHRRQPTDGNVILFKFPKPCQMYRTSLASNYHDVIRRHRYVVTDPRAFTESHIQSCDVCRKCQQWVKSCNRSDGEFSSIADVTKNTYICSKHFPESMEVLDPDILPDHSADPLSVDSFKQEPENDLQEHVSPETPQIKIEPENPQIKIDPGTEELYLNPEEYNEGYEYSDLKEEKADPLGSSSASYSTPQTGPDLRGLQALDSAVDDWFAKLAILGPVQDYEILEAANQLARSIGCHEFSADSEWLARFKLRHGPTGSHASVAQSSRFTPKQPVGMSSIQSITPEPASGSMSLEFTGKEEDASDSAPPPKMAKLEMNGLSNSDSGIDDNLRVVGNIFDGKDIKDAVHRLVFYNNMPKEDASAWVQKFFIELNHWISEETRSRQVGLQEMMDSAIVIATKLGNSSFRLREKFFLKLHSRHPHLFEDQKARPKASKALSSAGGLVSFMNELLKWYHEESAKRLLKASEVEREAFRISQNLAVLKFHPSKGWIKNFVERHGFYIDVNGKYTQFSGAAVGVLKHYWDANFEVWYSELPISLEDALEDDLNEKAEHSTKRFQAAVLEWFVKANSDGYVSPVEIFKNEALIAKNVFGLSDDTKCKTFCVNSGKKWQTLSEKLSNFDASVRKWYERRISSARVECSKDWREVETALKRFKVTPEELRKTAEDNARQMGIGGFEATECWLKRFVTLNGLYFEVSRWHICMTLDKIVGMDLHSLNNLLEEWYTGKPSTSRCSVEIALEPAGSSTLIKEEPLAEGRTLDEASDDIETALTLWCGEPKESPLTVDMVLEKAKELALQAGIASFVPTKHWLERFVKFQGFYSIRGNMICLFGHTTPLTGDVSKSLDLLFERWYEGSPRDESPSDGRVVHSVTAFGAVVYGWYARACKLIVVTPRLLEKRAVITAEEMGIEGFVPDKAWVLTFVARHGLQCSINGIRRLFFTAGFGVLDKYFDAAFEAWYYQLPPPLNPISIRGEGYIEDKLINDVSYDEKTVAGLRKYLACLFEWYVNESPQRVMTPKEIKCMDLQISRDMTSGKDKKLWLMAPDVATWYELRAEKFRKFDAAVVKWYNQNKHPQSTRHKPTSELVTPHELSRRAEELAKECEICGFEASKDWMKRFVELNGLKRASVGRRPAHFRLDCASVNSSLLHPLFELWYNCESPDWAITVNQMLQELAAFEHDRFSNCATPQSPSSSFEAQVLGWLAERSKRLVSPSELLQASATIAAGNEDFSFGKSEYWLNGFLRRHGLCRSFRDGKVFITKAPHRDKTQ